MRRELVRDGLDNLRRNAGCAGHGLGSIFGKRVPASDCLQRRAPNVLADKPFVDYHMGDAERHGAFVARIHVDPVVGVGPGHRHSRLDLRQKPALPALALAELTVSKAVLNRRDQVPRKSAPNEST